MSPTASLYLSASPQVPIVEQLNGSSCHFTVDSCTTTVDTLQFGNKLDNSNGIKEEKPVNRSQIEVKQL
jgi:hypothetical protein